jgi:phytanoyl-CoA hydroxylase
LSPYLSWRLPAVDASEYIISQLNMPFLSEDQVASFHRDGYLVLPDFLDGSTVEELRKRMGEIVNSFDLMALPNSPGFPKTVFTTKEQRRHTDDYFLESGYAIRFFWEEKAWVDGKLVRPPELSINKVGHGLHDLDDNFRAVSYDSRVGKICRDLGMESPLAVQSMYIFKQPLVGGEVGAHQDGTFLYTEPQSVIGFWWALDDCTLQNGCLWAVPGSHSIGVKRRYRREDPPKTGTEFVPPEAVEFDLTGAVPLETPKGTLVLLHNALVHYSAENLSEATRHAYSIHIVEGGKGVKYPADNWLQRPPEHPFNVIP